MDNSKQATGTRFYVSVGPPSWILTLVGPGFFVGEVMKTPIDKLIDEAEVRLYFNSDLTNAQMEILHNLILRAYELGMEREREQHSSKNT